MSGCPRCEQPGLRAVAMTEPSPDEREKRARAAPVGGDRVASPDLEMIVTLTGTGTPLSAPGRAGAGVLVACGNTLLQIDVGRGAVLRLAEIGLDCTELSAVFLTHHHSDHIMDLADVLITRWIRGATWPVPVVAPSGPASRFVEHVLDPFLDDIAVRITHGNRSGPPQFASHPFEAMPVPASVWSNDAVEVEAVTVRHEPVVPAVAYRVRAAGIAVVVSGDTRVCDEIEDLACGAALLVHEVVRAGPVHESGMHHVVTYHAEARSLGAMARRSGVGALMLTHLEPSPSTPDDAERFAEDVRAGGYDGALLVGTDLASAVVQVDGSVAFRTAGSAARGLTC